MIAPLSRSPARTPPCALRASFEPPTPAAGSRLDVLDGLVSIGQQAWMRCPVAPVLQ